MTRSFLAGGVALLVLTTAQAALGIIQFSGTAMCPIDAGSTDNYLSLPVETLMAGPHTAHPGTFQVDQSYSPLLIVDQANQRIFTSGIISPLDENGDPLFSAGDPAMDGELKDLQINVGLDGSGTVHAVGYDQKDEILSTFFYPAANPLRYAYTFEATIQEWSVVSYTLIDLPVPEPASILMFSALAAIQRITVRYQRRNR